MNKITVRLPDHIMAALQAEASRSTTTLSVVVRVTLAKALNLPLETGDSRAFQIPGSSFQPAKTVQVPFHLVLAAKAQIQWGYAIQAIKDLRAALDLNLYEAKTIVDILRYEGT